MGLCEHLGKCAMACVFFVFFWILLYSFGIRPPKITWFTTTSDRTIALFCKADPTQKQTVDLHETEKSCLGMRLGPGMRCLVHAVRNPAGALFYHEDIDNIMTHHGLAGQWTILEPNFS